MKTFILWAAALLVFAPQTDAAQLSPACAAKQADIQARLAEANARGRRHEVIGLKKALRANQANCTDTNLAMERDANIRKARKEVAEREKDLRVAKQKDDVEKVATRMAKLDEARRELAVAEQPLAR